MNRLKWKLDLNKKYKQTQVVVQAEKMTPEIAQLTAYMDQISQVMQVYDGDQLISLDLFDIFYIDYVERKTFVYTSSNMYEIDVPLYELEERFTPFNFIRINKQTILNPRSVRAVKSLFNSRIELQLENDEKLIVTRRYKQSFKQMFEKGGFFDA